MIDKIYKKDNYENQQIFHDIEQAKKYSNYSIELNQTFGDKSYDRFYKSLIEHKKARGLNFMSMFQKPKNATGLRMYEEPFNIKDFKSALKTMKKKNDKLLYRIKNPYKSRKITKEKKENDEENEKKAKSIKKMINTGKNKRMEKSQNQIKRDKYNIYLPDVPDVGRYTPSYKVLDKHSYQVAFCQQNFYDFNKKGNKKNKRAIFNDHLKIDYNYNDQPLTLEMKQKLEKSKIIPISLDLLNNMSKTYNKNGELPNNNELNKSINDHYNTSSIFNSVNSRLNTDSNINRNISSNIDTYTNQSNINQNTITDSKIFIRTNGDIHSRCPKHINNLNLSFNESLNNSDSFNNSSSYINTNSKNNHILKFETYTKRKPITKRFNYINENFLDTKVYKSVFPSDQNICIVFDKLSTAKDKQKCFFEVEANRNKYPPLGTYFPNYDHSFKKLVDIYIDKKSPPMTNKRKLKEIILRYDVPTNYLLFNDLNTKNDNEK